MNNIVSSLLLVMLMGSCAGSQERKNPPEYIQYVSEINKEFVRSVEKKYSLYCYGSGGSLPYDVASINLDFISYKKMNRDEARVLLVNLIEYYLSLINRHTQIRPYLREYPFPPERIGMFIGFRRKHDKPIIDDRISLVFQAKNKIYYFVRDPKTDRNVDFAEEPYSEALKKVQGEKG